MNIAPYIADHEHTFNSVCAFEATRIDNVPIDGFGVDLVVAHHGGAEFDVDYRVSHYDGGVARLRMTATQARKVHQQLSELLYGPALD